MKDAGRRFIHQSLKTKPGGGEMSFEVWLPRAEMRTTDETDVGPAPSGPVQRHTGWIHEQMHMNSI